MNTLPLLKACDLLYLSEEQIFALEHDIFELVFVDGTIETTKERTIWSWLLWDIHRQ